MEVAGLVLGVIPLAISAIDTYRAVFSSVKTAQRDLGWLRQDLETERIRLQNTCEILLVGIVRPSKIDDMISNPFGPDWKLYSDSLRLRLWTSWSTFEAQVASMDIAARELRSKLKIGEDGQTPLRDKPSILRELKENALFSLRKDDYKVLMNQIKTANTTLQALAKQDYGLESHRQSRSQHRLIKLVRSLSQSIHSALLNALTCACATKHTLGLELVARNAVLLPDDLEDQVAKDFDFSIVVDSAPNVKDEQPLKGFRLRLGDYGRQSPPDKAPPPPPSPCTSTKRHPGKWSKTVRLISTQSFSSPYSSSKITTPLVGSSKSLPDSQATLNLQSLQIQDVCRDIYHDNIGVYGFDHCYGYIADSQRRFEIYPPKKLLSRGRVFTLREVLDGTSEARLRPFNYPARLKLALSLCVSVLHLYGTPWLAKLVAINHIVLVEDDKCIRDTKKPQFYSPYQPFIARPRASEPELENDLGSSHHRPINTTLLSLGTLLIQIIVGKTFEELEMKGPIDMETIIAKHEMGNKLENRVMEGGGPNYSSAVKWCFANAMSVAGFQNEKFCQKFYEAVVARLQEDVRIFEDE